MLCEYGQAYDNKPIRDPLTPIRQAPGKPPGVGTPVTCVPNDAYIFIASKGPKHIPVNGL